MPVWHAAQAELLDLPVAASPPARVTTGTASEIARTPTTPISAFERMVHSWRAAGGCERRQCATTRSTDGESRARKTRLHGRDPHVGTASAATAPSASTC